MVQDLWRDEDEQKEDEKPVRVKEETVPVKVEVPDTNVQSLNLDPPRTERLSATDIGGGDSQMSYEMTVKEEPTRSPSGFIPRYSGSESRRPDRPGFSWGWSQYHDTEVVKDPRVSVDKMKSRVGSESPNKKVTYRSPYETEGGKSPGSVRPPQPSPSNKGFAGMVSRSRLPGTGTSPGNSSGSFGASLADLSPIALSNVVSHVVKSLPQFFSDSATVEKARLFWNAFEANTEGLPDQSRLLVFSQKLKGREAERWWGNSSIRDFKTLKLRFHNHFLSRTADELWERLQTTKRERGESIEEWGDRVSELCDSLDYPDARMRYQLFRRGLRNKRCLATLDSSPACDIPEATEWLMFKDMHRPIEEEDEFLGDAKTPNAVASSQAALYALSLKVDAILNAQSQRQTHQDYYQSRSPRKRSPRINADMFPGRAKVETHFEKSGWVEALDYKDYDEGPEIDLEDSVFLCWDESLRKTATNDFRTVTKDVLPPERFLPLQTQTKPLLDSGHEEGISSTVEALKYGRLFSDAELDAMETCNPGQEESVLSASWVEAEKEEYSKELEDRLYPLDEVELLKRRARNAETQREPSLSEVASLLNLPLETLELTKKVSSGGRDSPNFWKEWFQEALAHSEEARRANRDFRKSSENVVASVVASSHEKNKQVKGVPKKRSIDPALYR
ncbi:hypothetical protein PHMEG_00023558 [Phytophthora megakarya]|uniref:Retrotransposon gag domain-containing protein n=1 Tax=Phytophthora megakarya TaxID=4795 RepID=A0A225VGS7_9STRA|nr:hypothetical protein PHMEG_00023558 [Phytophthora megakarya]